MSEYYRVAVREYNEMIIKMAISVAQVTALQAVNSLLREDNQRLLNCIEKMALPSPPNPFEIRGADSAGEKHGQ